MENPRTSQQLRDSFDRQNKWLENLGFLLRFITLVGVIASIFFILNGISETKRQSQINQNYIRCIILLPPTSFTGTPEQRAKAIDDCAIQSKMPVLAKGDNYITVKAIAIGALVLAIGAVLSILLVTSRRLSTQIGEVHDEVKTANSLSAGELLDATELRRINKIPKKDQTQGEKNHVRDVELPK